MLFGVRLQKKILRYRRSATGHGRGDIMLRIEPFEGAAVLAKRLGAVIAGLNQQGLSKILTESDLLMLFLRFTEPSLQG